MSSNLCERMDEVSDLMHWLGLGLEAEADDRELEALRCYRRALSVDPKSRDALLGVARICLLLGEFERALETCTLLLTRHSGDAEAFRVRGLAMVNLELLEKGLDDLDRAIELQPERAEHWFSRGSCLLDLGAFERGVADLQRASALAPDDAELALRLLEGLLCRHAPVEDPAAARLLERARVRFADDPLFLLLEAELHLRAGDATAQHRLEALVEEEPELQSVRTRLEGARLDGTAEPGR